MGSGFSTKYETNYSYGAMEVGEQDCPYNRVFDEDYIDDFCQQMIDRPKVEGSSIDSNYLNVQDKYPLRTGGNLGEGTGKSGNNNWFSDDPMRDAMEMFSDLSYGGKTSFSENYHGIISKFGDSSSVMFRPYTSTPDSPAVEIRIINSLYLRGQKIHFLFSGGLK